MTLSLMFAASLTLFLAAPKGPAKPTSPPRPASVKPSTAHDVPSPPPPPPPSSLEQAGEVKEIELDERRAKAVYRVHTALTIPAVVEFPEAFAAPPACGDCADAADPGASSALFALDAEPGANYLVVKPRLYPGLQANGSNLLVSDFVTTITVRLTSLTLTLQVELVEDKARADPRVRFTLPNRPTESRYVAEAVAKAKAELEAAFAARVESAAGDHLLRAFVEPHECRANTARHREGDVVLELRELCRFGKRLYVRFLIENRGRSLFVLGEIAAGVGDGKAYTATAVRSLTTLPEVAFQQTAEGVAAFDVEDPTAHTFELRVPERGGRARTIALQGFGF
jgi:hypothetical protein